MNEIVKAFIPLSKVDAEQRMVWGYASTDNLDSQGEVVTRKAIEDALPEYMNFANIREMHSMSAVGVCKQADMDDRGLYIAVKVVDGNAWTKVQEGVYKGFSIGGRVMPGGREGNSITKMRLTEISLVDRPANPECVIDAWKADTLPEAATPEASASPVGTQQSETGAQSAVMEKGLSTVAWATELLERMNSLQQATAWEAKDEGDNSPVPEKLKALVSGFASTLKEMLDEELKEMGIGNEQKLAGDNADTNKADEANTATPAGTPPADDAAKADDAGQQPDAIAKKGARYSKMTKAALAKVHGMLRECDAAMKGMGYEDAEETEDDNAMAGKADAGGDLSKADGEVVELAKAAGIDAAEGATYADLFKGALVELKKSRDRVTELEAQPAPAKGARMAVAVSKGDDTNGNETVTKGADGKPLEGLDLLKAQLSQPLRLVPMGGIVKE